MQAAVLGTDVFDAVSSSDRGEGATLATNGPFTVEVTESTDDPTLREFEQDQCTWDTGGSVLLVPVNVRVTSNDLALDVSGPMLVQDDTFLGFIEHEVKLSGVLPDWVTDAADAELQDNCTFAGLSGFYDVYATLGGAVDAPALSISIRITGDCNSLGALASVQLEPVP